MNNRKAWQNGFNCAYLKAIPKKKYENTPAFTTGFNSGLHALFKKTGGNMVKQVGGNHYIEDCPEQEHWNVMAKMKANYFQGVITKYIDRYKKKNGLEDLQKALHYAQKYAEYIYKPIYKDIQADIYLAPLYSKYGSKSLESRAIRFVMSNQMGEAILAIQDLIDDYQSTLDLLQRNEDDV